MAKFTSQFLDEIRARLPVSEVVGRRVVLKRSGREFRGLSPFNKENTPSFFVNDQKMAWFDFSSARNGSIFDFLMQIDGLTFPQAVEQCAAMAGIPMPKDARVRNRSPDEQRSWEEQESRREAEMARWRAERDSENVLNEAEMIEAAAGIWRHVVPIAGTHAEAYLNARGLPTPKEG
jgi:DNA primase